MDIRPGPGQAQLSWHILMGGQPQVRALAAVARQRLADLTGLWFIPEPWLHLNVLRIGLRAELPAEGIDAMVGRARQSLAGLAPAEFTLGQVQYDPGAIVLAAAPSTGLHRVKAAIREAAGAVGLSPEAPAGPWVPHVMIASSPADQATDPFIAALGHELPRCPVTAERVHLVAQHGPEEAWDWQSLASVSLGGGPGGGGRSGGLP